MRIEKRKVWVSFELGIVSSFIILVIVADNRIAYLRSSAHAQILGTASRSIVVAQDPRRRHHRFSSGRGGGRSGSSRRHRSSSLVCRELSGVFVLVRSIRRISITTQPAAAAAVFAGTSAILSGEKRLAARLWSPYHR